MTNTELNVILRELDAAHLASGYGTTGATTFSKGADAIRFLLRERDALQLDLHFQTGTEVPC